MKRTQEKQYVWICEECGREFDELPFPASCECGNYCEDFFRLKDRWDVEDDKSGVPLLGVKYEDEVLEKRNKNLGKDKPKSKDEKVTVSMKNTVDDDLIIDFSTMNEIGLMNYLRSKNSDLIFEELTRQEMIDACKKIEG